MWQACQSPYLFAFLSLAVGSLAIAVTTPAHGTTWSSSGPNTVTWTRVSTDPNNAAITLVQQGVYKKTLADNVSTSQGRFTITGTLPVGNTFQINIVKSSSPQDLNTILAQSAQFNVTQGSTTTSSAGPSSTSINVSTGPATTIAVSTASGTSLPTGLPNSTSTILNPTGSPSNAASALVQYHGVLLAAAVLSGIALIWVDFDLQYMDIAGFIHFQAC